MARQMSTFKLQEKSVRLNGKRNVQGKKCTFKWQDKSNVYTFKWQD